MAMLHHRLPGNFGTSVPCEVPCHALPDADLRALHNLLTEHRFVVIPGQQLNNDQYVEFAGRWGRPLLLIAKKNQLASHPEMIVQGNSAATPDYVRNVACNWHCDSSYEEDVATCTMLYGVETPNEGGDTLFADLVAAYDALSGEKQALYDTLTVKHATSAATPLPDEHIPDRSKIPPEIAATVTFLDPVSHPLVRINPYSGRKALYGLGGSPYAIEGMSDAEGAELILELRRYAIQDRFRSAYKLMPGDLLIWDNLSVMHRATPIEFTDEPGKRRLNYRISLKGPPRFLDAPEIASAEIRSTEHIG
ncbi:TauD/TfdA dioxygenase family protein [Rhizorhabdus argentea]|uniref:TauD/TfdA dioxygenase family protein n=1 Tax=Rhizorhabdus argentea TaxID=1387174 RepID=UPI0030EF7310